MGGSSSSCGAALLCGRWRWRLDEAPLELELLGAGDEGRAAVASSARRFRDALLAEQLDCGDVGRPDDACEFDFDDCLEIDRGRIPSLEERDAVSDGVVIGGNKDNGAMPTEDCASDGYRPAPYARLARKRQPRPYQTWKEGCTSVRCVYVGGGSLICTQLFVNYESAPSSRPRGPAPPVCRPHPALMPRRRAWPTPRETP